MVNQSKWYQKPVTVILFLIFFFPVGLYLMWQHNLWNKPVRIIISGLIGLILILNNSNNGNKKPSLGEYSSFGHDTDIYCGSSNYVKLKSNGQLEFYTKVNGKGFPSCREEGFYSIDENNTLTISGLNSPNAMGLDTQFNGQYTWGEGDFGIYSFFKIDNNITLSNYGK